MSTYYTDKPIDSFDDDLLERGSFARILSNTLINLKYSDTFTVGLFGKWGTGKTSIVNMALQEIENSDSDKDVVVVRFEPWHFSDSSQLLSQFFVRLSNEFKGKSNKNLQKIGKAIEKYSSALDLAKLIPVYGDIISSTVKVGAIRIGKKLQKDSSESDVINQKNQVVELLKKQKSRILVVIDDIDRLSSDQIRLVFQLVASVAKFPNTAYLLVFDKDVVVKSLEKVQEGDGEDYLEKVIQMPIQIPEIRKENLNTVLFNRLDQILSTYPETSFYNQHWQEIFPLCVEPFISNLRDINRLCNSLRFKMTSISSEIDFADMIAVSTLEITFPKVYEWIKSEKDTLTINDGLQSFGTNKKTQSEWLTFYKQQIKTRLLNKDNVEDVDSKTKLVITALSTLFPRFGNKIGENYLVMDEDLFRRKNLISHPEKFDRYFYYDIDKVLLKRSDLDKMILISSTEEFIKFLIDNDRNNQGIEVLQELKAMLSEIDSERAAVLFKALILSTGELKTIERKSIISVGAAVYSEHLCLDLLERVNVLTRKEMLTNLVKDLALENLNTLAIIINIMELSYGRLAAKGVEHNYKKVISLEELEELELCFVERLKELLKAYNLFECSDWRMLLHLMESFDEEYANNYVKEALKDNINILSYLWRTVSLWTGAGNSYEIHDDYKKYLSQEDIIKAIKEEVNAKRIFSMKEDILNRSAAFYLNSLGCTGYDSHIPQTKVNEIILKWEKSGFEENPNVIPDLTE